MKKNCLILFSLVLFSTAHSQVQCSNDPEHGIVDIYFRLPYYSITDTILPDIYTPSGIIWKYVKVDDESFGMVDSVGFPELPLLTLFINIPRGAEDLTVEFTPLDSSILYLNNDIIPCQSGHYKDSVNGSLAIDYNSVFYSGSISFPQEKSTINEIFFVRDREGLALTILPFHYLPGGRLLVINSARITLKYRFSDLPTVPPADSYVWESSFERIFSNYTALFRTGGTSGRILMVVPSKYSTQIGSYMAYKRNIGYAVDTINLLPIDAIPNTIKAKITQRYNNTETRPDFILLIGDQGDLPAYEGDPSGGNDTLPLSDVPYAFLNGDDYMVDAYIGRWSVSNTTTLQAIINKTIFMESNMHLFDKEALFITGDHKTEDGFFVRQYMLNQFSVANDHVSLRHFGMNGFNSQNLKQPQRDVTFDAFERNPLVLVYSGHGDFQSIGPVHYPNPNFKIVKFTIDSIQHEVFPMMFVFACKTGNYGYYESIGESWISSYHGSVSYLGSSIISKTNSDNIIEKAMLGKVFFEEPYMGGVVARGMQKFRRNGWIQTKIHKIYTKAYNLMGDPSFLTGGWGCGHDLWVENMIINKRDTHVYHAANNAYFFNCNTINDLARMVVTAGDEISVTGEFTASRGSDVIMKIESCNTTTQMKGQSLISGDSIEYRAVEQSFYDDDVIVYPSLTQKNVYVRYPSDKEHDMSVYLVDIYGRVIWHKVTHTRSVGICTEEIDVDRLPSGNYFVIVTSGANVIYSKCIMKY